MKKSSSLATFLGSLLLLLWGGTLIYFHVSGRLAKGDYVSSVGWFRPMVLVGGIGCVLVALFNLATLGVKDPETTASEGETGGMLENNGLVGWLVTIAILVAPLTYATMKSPDSLASMAKEGAYSQNYQKDAMAGKFDVKSKANPVAASGKGSASSPAPTVTSVSTTSSATSTSSSNDASAPPATTSAASKADAPPSAAPGSTPPAGAAQSKSYGSFTLADLKSQVEQSPEGNFKLEVPEIYYTAGDKEVQGVLTGQPIETVAQVIPEKLHNENGTRVRVFRMLIQCCAADARPYSIPVEFTGAAPKIKDMTWVKVTGKMGYEKQGDQTVPLIQATSMKEVTEPENKMVY